MPNLLHVYSELEDIDTLLCGYMREICTEDFDSRKLRGKVDACFNRLIILDLQSLNHLERSRLEHIYKINTTMAKMVNERSRLIKELEKNESSITNTATRFSESQKAVLLRYFTENPDAHTSPNQCILMSDETGLTLKQIKNWYVSSLLNLFEVYVPLLTF